MSGHRVLIKRGSGNRGPTECGTTHEKKQIIADAAKDNKVVHQLIDLALLQNGMLRGEALDKFLKRSVELIG